MIMIGFRDTFTTPLDHGISIEVPVCTTQEISEGRTTKFCAWEELRTYFGLSAYSSI